MSGFLQRVSGTGFREMKLERSSSSAAQVVYNCTGKKVKNKVNEKMSKIIFPF